MSQATIQQLGNCAACRFGITPFAHRDKHQLVRALEAIAATHWSMQHQRQKQFFRQTSWTRAVSVKTTAFPTLKQSGEHGYLGRAREKVAAMIPELGVGKEFRQWGQSENSGAPVRALPGIGDGCGFVRWRSACGFSRQRHVGGRSPPQRRSGYAGLRACSTPQHRVEERCRALVKPAACMLTCAVSYL